LSLCPFSYDHCVVCPSWITDFDYTFDIFKLFLLRRGRKITFQINDMMKQSDEINDIDYNALMAKHFLNLFKRLIELPKLDEMT